jgi:hypothetical protein
MIARFSTIVAYVISLLLSRLLVRLVRFESSKRIDRDPSNDDWSTEVKGGPKRETRP